MKKKITSILICSLILNFASIAVLAGSAREIINGYLCRDIKMEWNGNEFTPTEPDTGERVYPIIYNDRTYLPLRFIAEKAGVEVGWDEENSSVLLSTDGFKYPTTNGSDNKEEPFSNLANLTLNKFKYEFIGGALSGCALKLEENSLEKIDANGNWIGEDWSVGSSISYVFPELYFEPIDEHDKSAVPNGFNSLCGALENNGFKLYKIDEFGKRHYVNGNTEINVWNIAQTDTRLLIDMKTGYQACCVE